MIFVASLATAAENPSGTLAKFWYSNIADLIEPLPKCSFHRRYTRYRTPKKSNSRNAPPARSVSAGLAPTSGQVVTNSNEIRADGFAGSNPKCPATQSSAANGQGRR